VQGRIVIALLLCSSAVPLARAEDTAVPLEELREEALRKNPEILAAQKRYEAARQVPSQAASLPDPMLSLGYNSVGSPRPFAGIGQEPVANAGIMVSQRFPFPGKRKLRGEIAERDAEAEFQQYQAVQLSVLARLKQAYYRLDNTYTVEGVLERNRDLLRKFLRISEARYSVGKAAQQDIFKAQTQLSILETRIERVRQERSSREGEINALLGRPPDSPMRRPVPAEPAPLALTLDDLVRAARENSPLLRREQKMIERTQLAVNLARKDYYPDYTLSGGYFHMGSMPSMYMARVDFELPVYFWRKQRAGVAEQANSLGQARHGYEAAGQALGFRIKDDFLLAETSYRLMRMYSGTVVPQSSLALQSSLSSYETGAVDFLSVIANFSTMLEYELNYREELLNYLLATARLEEATGVPVMR
jgi:outer membrane protein TolC